LGISSGGFGGEVLLFSVFEAYSFLLEKRAPRQKPSSPHGGLRRGLC
jgi:hypothetical protein